MVYKELTPQQVVLQYYFGIDPLVYVYYRYRDYREMMVDVVEYGLYCSVHQTIHAGDTVDYFDSDLYLSEPRNIKRVLRWFKEEFSRERAAHGSIELRSLKRKTDRSVQSR